MPILEACASSCPAMSAMSTPRRYCAMVASTSTLRFGPVKQRTHRIVDLLAERSEWGGGGSSTAHTVEWRSSGRRQRSWLRLLRAADLVKG